MVNATADERLEEFRILALDLVTESETNPRRTFDPKGLEDLVASVKEKGVLSPILVRPVGARFEVVAGARRYRAAKKAGLAQIPAMIRDLNDDEALEAQVVENLQRADIHPLEEAEGYKVVLARKRLDVDQLAARVGKNAPYIQQRLKLTDLTAEAKKAFLDGGLLVGHALMLARLQPADQKEALEVCATREYVEGIRGTHPFTMGVRALQDWIQSNVLLSLDGAPWQKDDATLLPKAGSCDACPKRSGNAPTLWPDVTRPKICTDRTCYQLKLAAHVARAAQELEAAGKKVVKISTEWGAGKGVLGTSEYYIAAGKKRCEKTVLGFYVDGDKRGKTTDVCPDRACRIHKPKNTYSSSGSSASAEDGKEREQRIIKERATERARHEIFRQVIQKTKRLDRKDLELLAQNGNFGLPYVLEGDGWIKDLSEPNLVAKASDEDLAKYLLGIAIGHQQLDAHGDAEILYRAAALRKLDVKAIEKDAARQVTQERMHHAKRQAWKGRAAASARTFDQLTCAGCGRNQAEQAKGGWHWVKKNDKTKAAQCNDCEREENERQ